jgi:hypothetical protein
MTIRFMRTVLFGYLLFAFVSQAQEVTSQPSPAIVLQRARARALEDMGRVPRYTCRQDIARRFYASESSSGQSCSSILAKRDKRKHDPELTSLDHFQVEVAVADHHEVYSWLGSPFTQTGETEIRQTLANGPFGTGDFAGFVNEIFGGSATILFHGERTVQGRTLLEYTFSVARGSSHYYVQSLAAPAITSYDGSFLLDSETSDLVDLTVRTAELPRTSRACQALSDIEYQRLSIRGRELFVPRKTNLRLTYQNGREATAITSYSSCREFTSTSVIRFDDPVMDDARKPTEKMSAQPGPPTTSPFVPGTRFECQIVTPIETETPAGIPIEEILLSPLRDRDKKVVAARGDRVSGRLLHLTEHKTPVHYFDVAMRLESVEVNGIGLPLYAVSASTPYPLWLLIPAEGITYDLPGPRLPNTGIFLFPVNRLQLQGWKSTWVISSAPGSR